MKDIKKVAEDSADTFQSLKKFSAQIQENLELLKKRKNLDRELKRSLKKFMKKNQNSNINIMNDTLFNLLLALGSFIVLSLLAILYKVSNMKKLENVI